MRFLLIFFLVFTFSCSEDSVTNDSENNNPEFEFSVDGVTLSLDCN